MLRSPIGYLILCLGAALFTESVANVYHLPGSALNQSDHLIVWIFFKDKPSDGLSKVIVAPRALARRSSIGYIEKKNENTSVYSGYINAVVASGGIFRHNFKWSNAASFEVPIRSIPYIKALPCVKEISLVGKTPKREMPILNYLQKRKSGISERYGALYDKLARLRIPQAHRYLAYTRPGEMPGKGVTMAVFDNGFRLEHRCFAHLKTRSAVIATYDFVENDTNVFTKDDHGSSVLSIIAAYDPPYYCGTAWGVDLLLAKTESDDYESHSEEDNWAAAVIWAEEKGVDIISCSLGYRDFDSNDTVIIDRGNGVFDTLDSYLKSDLDGKTTVISRAARGAVERGVIVVNAVGNEQQEWGDTSLSVPADVDGVVAVGALNNNNLITYYSSFGPTSDGRTKPDLVAPGDINIPRFDSTNNSTDYTSTIAHGTSLATPFVSGVFALVKQLYPSLPPDSLRLRVYRSCRFLNHQTTIDNVYGHGIPDAVRACMQSDSEVVIIANDSGNVPLAGAIIKKDTTQCAVTDSNGVARYTSSTVGAYELSIFLNNRSRIIQIDSVPAFIEVQPCSLLVTVVDDDNKSLSDVAVHFKIDEKEAIHYTDAEGSTTIGFFFPETVQLYVSKPGYYRSDTITTALNEIINKKKIVLTCCDAGFIVYPTIVKRSYGQQLYMRFADNSASNGTQENGMHATVRSVNGTLIWEKMLYSDGSPVLLTWNCRRPDGRSVVPGIYFITLVNNGKMYRQKFIIAE